MIVSEQYKFVYFDIPKTASATLDQVFRGYGGAVIPIHPRNIKHNRTVPERAKDYTKIASIRDPYERLLSHYFFEYKRGRNVSLEQYVDFHLDCLKCSNDEIDPEKYRYFPCSKYLAPLGKIDFIIKLENIEKDLEQIPFYSKQTLGWGHKNPHPKLSELNISKELMNKINSWAKIDCQAYGYPIRGE